MTIIILVDAYSDAPRNSIWIVPGATDDFEDPANEDRYPHIDDYLSQRGIQVVTDTKPHESDRRADDIADRFRAAGFETIIETLCND